ncbi:MAG: FAD-dependent thymidylate synthase [Armatimonadetes bacterium]|nr:FAD-dependent thymidylate synthase [Armatimonadota bacterium]
MAHVIVQEAEELLDKEFPVLDHGFVRLVDYLGGDARIVQSARVSYGPGTKSVRDDTKLINYLMKHGHTSPFEQVVLTFHVKMPIFVARQWARHRTARTNEISGRYSVLSNEMYTPGRLPIQSTDNKQGSSDESVSPEESEMLMEGIRRQHDMQYELYQRMLDKGVSREIARTILPLALYTEMYWQIDLHNLFNFLRQRLDNHAQYEIRQYAETISKIVKAVAPIAWEAFEEHVLYARTLSRSELEAPQPE